MGLEMALPFCSFSLLAKKSKKAEPTRLSSRCALLLCVSNLLFGSLPFVSDFVLRISNFLTAEDKRACLSRCSNAPEHDPGLPFASFVHIKRRKKASQRPHQDTSERRR